MATTDPRVPCLRCPHQLDAHQHHRRGVECALCDCPAFTGRPSLADLVWGFWVALGAWRQTFRPPRY